MPARFSAGADWSARGIVRLERRDILRYSAAAMDLLLFGIQGGGKGTQAKKLVERFGFHHFEAGAELRAIIASGSDLGKEVSSYVDHGSLVPHGIIMQVMREAMAKIPAAQAVLFDGIPRDADQKRDFDGIMEELGREFRCIELTVDENLAIQRILQRGKEQGRKDDQDETFIRKRMGWTREKTQPIIEEYRAQGRVATIDGDAPVEDVHALIVDAMEKFGFAVR